MPVQPNNRWEELRKAVEDAQLPCSREALGHFFEATQCAYSRRPEPLHASFMAVTTKALVPEAAADCLAYAAKYRWLPAIAGGLANMAPKDRRAAFLEAVLPARKRRIRRSAASQRGLVSADQQVCIIRHHEDGAIGTGVLVGPDLILTAYHVVEKYWKAADGHLLLEAWFTPSHREPPQEPVTNADAIRVPFTEDWRGPYSSIHEVERGKLSKWPDYEQIRNNLDFAVIRLDGRPGLTRGVPEFENEPLVPDRDRDREIEVRHAPARGAMVVSSGAIYDVFDVTDAVRVGYVLNDRSNAGGSSGGPCFDLEGRLLAIHQRSVQGRAGGCAGVVWTAVASIIEDAAPPAQTDNPPLWWIRSCTPIEGQIGFRQRNTSGPYFGPLIGRHGFQRAVNASVQGRADAPQVFFIDGPPRSGVTLSLRILETMLHERDHVIAAIDVRSAATRGVPYIEMMYEEVHNVAAPSPAVRPYELSTGQALGYARVRSTVRARLDQIDRMRDGRKVWLVVDGFKFQPTATEFDRLSLEALYELTPRYDWLRTVYFVPKPSAIPDERVFIEYIEPPTLDEVAYYLKRRMRAARITFTDGDAQQLAGEIIAKASSLLPPGESLSSAQAGLAVEEVLLKLIPAASAVDTVVSLSDPWW